MLQKLPKIFQLFALICGLLIISVSLYYLAQNNPESTAVIQTMEKERTAAQFDPIPMLISTEQLSSNSTLPTARGIHQQVILYADLPIYRYPNNNAQQIGTLPLYSKYMQVQTTAWVLETTDNGQWGRVVIPWADNNKTGWIKLEGEQITTTNIAILIDRSDQLLSVIKNGELLMKLPAGMGSPASPTPLGKFYVSERVNNPGGAYGAYAFGLSGIQTNPPVGWTGPAQMAFHGTNIPASISKDMSAGCPHLSTDSLMKLVPLIKLGTPVTIVA
jgi:lipoprotein-anchoring transpeptidase ErfK/SrfK